jgi:hypothetical protein
MVLAIIAALAFAWVAAGALSQGLKPVGTDKCASCRALDEWWRHLGAWGKLKGAAWYFPNKAICKLKGC